MAIRNESVTENFFFKKQNAPTDSEGSKAYCNFFLKLPNLLESGFSTCRTSSDWTWSSVKTEKAKTLKILGHDI